MTTAEFKRGMEAVARAQPTTAEFAETLRQGARQITASMFSIRDFTRKP